MTPIAKKFWAFHIAYPDVYDELQELALKMLRRGRSKWSIDGLFEVLRWERALTVEKGEGDFKLNNNFRAFYARLLMRDVPALAGFFDLRDSEADIIGPKGGWPHEQDKLAGMRMLGRMKGRGGK